MIAMCHECRMEYIDKEMTVNEGEKDAREKIIVGY